MSSGTTRKRVRVDTIPGDQTPPKAETVVTPASEVASCRSEVAPVRTQDQTFWYDDGTVIIHTPTVAFRVYKGLLANRSPVFEDMFSLPQPSPSRGLAEAYLKTPPVVEVPDSPEDWRHLLQQLMPGEECSPYPSHSESRPTFDSISALLRLGHKYQMNRLVEQSVEYLKKHYGNTMESWEKDTSDYPELDGSCCIAVVNLARLVDAPVLLPPALLACCGLGASVVDGYEREDGTREYLSPEDLGRCFEARAKIVQESMKIALLVLAPEASSGCRTRRTLCERAMSKTLAALHGSVGELGCFNLFAPFEYERMGLAGAVCEACFAMVKERDLKHRKALWKALPSILNVAVEGWDTDDVP